jgi:hypothetical protein
LQDAVEHLQELIPQ